MNYTNAPETQWMLCFNLYIPFLFVLIDRVPSTICWCVFFSIVDAINFFSHFFQIFNVWRERKTGKERGEEKTKWSICIKWWKKWESKEKGNCSETTSKCNHNIRRRLAIISVWGVFRHTTKQSVLIPSSPPPPPSTPSLRLLVLFIEYALLYLQY